MGENMYAIINKRANVAGNDDKDYYFNGLSSDIDPDVYNDLRRIFLSDTLLAESMTMEERLRRHYLLFSVFSKYSLDDVSPLDNNDPRTAPGGLYLDLCGYIYEVPDFEQNVQCPICMESYGLQKYVRQLACGHKFHLKCGYEWILRKMICPMCHIKINLNTRADNNTLIELKSDDLVPKVY